MSTDIDAPPKAGSREWLGLAVLALPTLLVSIDVSILHLAVPHFSEALRPSATQTLWIVDLYGFMLAGFLVTMGTLGDRVGRRRLLLIGGACFGIASLAAAFASSPLLLMGARAAMGLAAATLMPSTLALIMSMFQEPRQRGTAIGVWVTMFSAGIALGPVVGGALLTTFWWGSVFLIAIPVVAILLLAGPRLLPEYRNPGAGRLDLLSVALFLAAILPAVYGIKEAAANGLSATVVLVLLASGVAAIAFVRRQNQLSEPLLDLRLLRNRTISACLAAMLLSMFVAGGMYLFVTQYLQLVQGLSPIRAGLWLLPSAALLTVTSLLTPAAAARYRPGHVIAAGLAMSAVGHALLATAGETAFFQIITGFTLAYGGGGPLIALGTDLVLGSAPPEQAGAASSMSETSTELGVALGVALLGSAGLAMYRSGLTMAADVPDAVRTAAQEGLANVLAVTSADGNAAGVAELLRSAQAAFTNGLNLVGVVSLVLSLLLIAICLVAVRARPLADAGQEATPQDQPSVGNLA
jgi:DHA2 family multidrug resistance protein-like MFS transporter